MTLPRRRWALIAALILWPTLAFSQEPDYRGEVALSTPTYRGHTAVAPIPPKLHVRNEGGSDQAGLCVISSVLANGRYQGVPGLGSFPTDVTIGQGGKDSRLWRLAKSRPGGYSPDKLQRLVDEAVPGEPWASYVGTETAVLERLSRMGYPIGATMNTGQQYGYQPIHHMISLVDYSESRDLACVVDNNDPGKYHWMPAREFARRWIDGGTGWAWVWTRLPGSLGSAGVPAAVTIASVAGLLLAFSRYRSLEMRAV